MRMNFQAKMQMMNMEKSNIMLNENDNSKKNRKNKKRLKDK